MINRQTQEGGDGSTNFQAQNIYIQGIDEKRAREICQEMNLQLKKEYSEEAFQIATGRVSEFENILMQKMEKFEGALQAFTDPSFQLLLVDAQKSAASTERVVDYELLSELLIHRFQKGENRLIRAGIRRAVEVVDEISNEALLGLTVFHSVQNFLPATGDILKGLDILNELFGKVIYGELPNGMDWIDHLDILDAVRINSAHQLKDLSQYYSEMLSGFIDVGIRKNSENHTKALDILKSCDINEQFLVEHALNPEYVRLSVTSRSIVPKLEITTQIPSYGALYQRREQISTRQQEALFSIYDLYDKDANLKAENARLFMVHFNSKNNLNKLHNWWNDLKVAFQITSVGKVLAHANAQRCDNKLPPLY